MTTHANPVTIYYCGREQCQPGHSFGPAIRQHYLLHIVLNGRGRFEDGRKNWRLQSGQAFLIHPGEITFYEADAHNPWEYAWIGMEGYEVPSILERCGFDPEHPVSAGTDRPGFREAACDLVHTFENNARNEFELLAGLYRLLAFLADPATPEAGLPPDIAYFAEAKAYIQNNYGYDIRISDIARHIGIDRTYLFKLFKRESGSSPQQYLIDFRLKAALNMMEHPGYSITEIAFSCGFRDTPSFCKHFKKKTGKTPSEYRRTKEQAILKALEP